MSDSYDFTLRSFEAEAASVVDRARQAARQILRTALVEAGRLREQAKVEAQKLGLDEGRAQGAALAQKKVAEETRTLAAALQASVAAIDGRKEQLLHEVRHDVVELAVAAAERIVRARIQTDPAVAERAVEEALRIAGRRRGLEVHLNPADHAAMARPDSETVRFVADPAVERGGCLVRAENADVDARLSTQLDHLKEALLG